ncbi:hypothetical protein [Brevibacillus sp. 179-C9.3 HS]|uniref:hypothetical protein n=1 Tax=unclassified Brevibacillus TaxID=2684853 RepID=UPI0039A3A679
MNKIFEPFIRRARTLPRTQLLICLALFDNACDQDGYIWVSDQEIAEKVDSTINYVRECMAKMIREGILTSHPQFGNMYRFTYVPLSVQYERGNHYCKTYKLFYTPNFRNLPVNAMRILLEALFELSKSGQDIVTLPESRFHSRSGFSALTLDRNSRFDQLLQTIQNHCGDYVTIQRLFKLNQYTRKQEKFIQFTFTPVALQADSYKKEQLLLENTFRLNGLHQFANNEENLIAILKEQKARFASAERIMETHILRQREYFFEWSRRVLRHAFNEALDRFIRMQRKNQTMDLSTPDQVQAYFSSVYQDSIREQLQIITKDYYARYTLLSEMTDIQEKGQHNLYTKFSNRLEQNGFLPYSKEEIFQEVALRASLVKLLEEMLTGWVRARLGKDAEGKSKLRSRFSTKEEAIDFVKALCEKEAEGYKLLSTGFKGLISSSATAAFNIIQDTMIQLRDAALAEINKLFPKTA